MGRQRRRSVYSQSNWTKDKCYLSGTQWEEDGGRELGRKVGGRFNLAPPPLPTHTHTHLGTSSRFPFKYSIKKTRCSRMTVTLGYVGRPHVYIYVSGKELKCGGTPIREPDFGLVTSANSSFIISQVRP